MSFLLDKSPFFFFFFFLKVILCIMTFDAIYFGVLVEKTLYWETRLRPAYSLALKKLANSVVSI